MSEIPEPEIYRFDKRIAYRFHNLFIVYEGGQFLAGVMDQKNEIPEHPHGTVQRYRYCRCEPCRAAWSAHSKEYRKTHPDKRNKKWHNK